MVWIPAVLKSTGHSSRRSVWAFWCFPWTFDWMTSHYLNPSGSRLTFLTLVIPHSCNLFSLVTFSINFSKFSCNTHAHTFTQSHPGAIYHNKSTYWHVCGRKTQGKPTGNTFFGALELWGGNTACWASVPLSIIFI